MPKLNENQLGVMAELASVGGRLALSDLRERLRIRKLPESTVTTLVKRGLIAIEEEPEEFALGGIHSAGKKHAHEHAPNEEQMEAVGTLAAAMVKGGFRPHLLFGVTGSGKTSVYFAAMRRALDAERVRSYWFRRLG